MNLATLPRLRASVRALVVLSLAFGGSAASVCVAQSEADLAALRVVATTGHIGDALRRVAPALDVFVLVGPGLDPHTYEASTRDIQRLRGADLVFWNALDLEAQMARQIRSLGERQVALGERVPETLLLPFEGGIDPHIWNSTEIWTIVVHAIADALSARLPAHADAFAANAEAYAAEIAAADVYARERLMAIPEARRVLVSGHDAFNYFAAAYGFQALAVEGISTADEASIQDLRELADFIVERGVPVIFYENITDRQATNALREAVQARGWDVRIADRTLYSDSLGDTPPLDTYLGTFLHNVDTIVAALGGVE
jgi:manganese/zinc/iron transport system substrate-binding protein